MGNERFRLYEEVSAINLENPLKMNRLKQQLHQVQTYMNITAIFLDLNRPKPCFILCNWSLDAILKAVYMKEHVSIFPPREFSL
ncbi:hypothetical protein D3C71_1493770 [compost metagenome]